MAIAGLLAQLAIDGVMTHSRSRVSEAKKQWGMIAAGAASGVIALCFLTSALYMGLTLVFIPALAALTTGVVIGTVALGCLYCAKRTEEREGAQQAARQPAVMPEQIGEIFDGLMSDLEQPVKDNPGTALLLATLAGFMTADRLH